MNRLSQGKFSNWVVQHVMEHAPEYFSQVVGALIQCDLLSLVQKQPYYGKSVVEGVLKLGDPKSQSVKRLSMALATQILSTPNLIVEMALDHHQCGVVKRMLKTLEGTPRYEALRQLGRAWLKLKETKAARPIANFV